jgi:hypothetical protein
MLLHACCCMQAACVCDEGGADDSASQELRAVRPDRVCQGSARSHPMECPSSTTRVPHRVPLEHPSSTSRVRPDRVRHGRAHSHALPMRTVAAPVGTRVSSRRTLRRARPVRCAAALPCHGPPMPQCSAAQRRPCAHHAICFVSRRRRARPTVRASAAIAAYGLPCLNGSSSDRRSLPPARHA